MGWAEHGYRLAEKFQKARLNKNATYIVVEKTKNCAWKCPQH